MQEMMQIIFCDESLKTIVCPCNGLFMSCSTHALCSSDQIFIHVHRVGQVSSKSRIFSKNFFVVPVGSGAIAMRVPVAAL